MSEVNLNDINKQVGAIHGDKYNYVVGKYGLYYKWNTEFEKDFQPGFNWSGVFRMKDSISLKSTIRTTGEKEKRNFGDRTIEIPITEPTGYLRQEFNFINKLFYNYSRNTDEYEAVLKLFNIKHSQKVNIEKIPLISAYRDSLMNQIKRQIEAVEKLNSEIIDVLKVFYFEGEKETLKGNVSDYSTEELNKRGSYFTEKNHQIKLFVEVLIAPGAKSDLIENHRLTNEMLSHAYLGNDITEPTLNGIITLTKERDPLLIVSAKLASTISALESILGDVFLNDKLKSIKQFIIANQNIHSDESKEWIANKVAGYQKKGYSFNKAYETSKIEFKEYYNSPHAPSKSTIERYLGLYKY
jgi:hypothetical protein